MILPSAIIFVNDDLTNNVRNKLKTQLFLTHTFTNNQFIDLIDKKPEFIDEVKTKNFRVLVEQNLHDIQNIEYADFLIFVRHGLVSVLDLQTKNIKGIYPVVNITWAQILNC